MCYGTRVCVCVCVCVRWDLDSHIQHLDYSSGAETFHAKTRIICLSTNTG